MSIVLASVSVLILAAAIHLSMGILGAVLVGAGAGMAFLAGTTLLGGEIADDVRGQVFAFVQTGTRVVLMLAISLSSLLVGLGGSRQFRIADLGISISSTRLLLLAAGVAGIFAGLSAFRQMDDKPGVPVLADLWGSVRGRPLSPAEPFVSHGAFIVFEGCEGAGKSTQVTALAEALRRQGRDVVVTREPGATDVGERIRGLVLGASSVGLAPRAEALLYAADRAHHVATVVRPALARGAVVISDRYVDSSLAYQGAGRTLPVDEVSWLSSWATGGLRPDLVVLLDVEPAVGLARARARGKGTDRLEAEPTDFHERVRYAFLDLAIADPKRYLVLDAAGRAEEIAETVVAKVTTLLPEPPADDTARDRDDRPDGTGSADARVDDRPDGAGPADARVDDRADGAGPADVRVTDSATAANVKHGAVGSGPAGRSDLGGAAVDRDPPGQNGGGPAATHGLELGRRA
jgi:dTMP kinase